MDGHAGTRSGRNNVGGPMVGADDIHKCLVEMPARAAPMVPLDPG
jgi:hypothetical protein